jgi:hypothetical protein
MIKAELIGLSLLAGVVVGGIGGFAAGKQSAPAVKPVEVSELCQSLRPRDGVTVMMAGIDTVVALRTLCNAVEELERRPTSSSTCVLFQLTINEALDPDAVATIRGELQDIAPKVAEACEAVQRWGLP